MSQHTGYQLFVLKKTSELKAKKIPGSERRQIIGDQWRTMFPMEKIQWRLLAEKEFTEVKSPTDQPPVNSKQFGSGYPLSINESDLHCSTPNPTVTNTTFKTPDKMYNTNDLMTPIKERPTQESNLET